MAEQDHLKEGFALHCSRPLASSLILNGEMSEWLKEHAWKAIPSTLTEQHRNTFRAINSAVYAPPMLLDVTP